MAKKKKTGAQEKTRTTLSESHLSTRKRLAFPVVAIGASAGGLEALKLFFEAMPAEAGIAFVIIQHLDPEKLSLMAEILSRCTEMGVSLASHNTLIKPGQVYVVPPGQKLLMQDGRLILSALARDKPPVNRTVDDFFRSMAEEQGERSICIVLSGTGTDGALGLMEIKAAGGMAMAQEPRDASYDGMPVSAINTGLVDFVLPARSLPAELLHYVRHTYYDDRPDTLLPKEESDALVAGILDLLGKRLDNDFSGYKRGTLVRRIKRRMDIHHMQDLRAYADLLESDNDELTALAKDLLIVVTGFFRDQEAFSLLQSTVIAPLCQRAAPETPIRVWVSGTATGEEAYSIAILILEELTKLKKEHGGVQILATDVDRFSLQQARAGIFPAAIEADVSKERLSRFFQRHENGYRVRKSVREAITFSEQDLIRDTPFSRIDLISCRNLLIYLKPETQRRVLSLFHFALKPAGVLFLGSAESIGRENDLFKPVDKKWRIFKKIDSVRVPLICFPRTPGGGALFPPMRRELKQGVNLKALGERQILDHFSPCGVIVNQAAEILQFIGKTSNFLQVPEGDPTLNLLAMVPAVMRTPLRGMLQDLSGKKQQQTAVLLRLLDHEDKPYRHVQVSARRIEDESIEDELFLVTFSDLPECAPPLPLDSVKACAAHELMIRQLEEELFRTRDDLESTIEQMEIAYEELKAGNEEAMSINEEFQSTNEELETSKEELQSMNEELTTVNSELEDKLTELEEINNDLDNLLACSDVGFLFLDEQFRIKRFTPAIQKLFPIIQGDIGRPLTDFGNALAGFSLLDEAEKVLHSLIPSDKEVQAADGRWYLQRVMPYRTRGNHIQGVLITFPDITMLKEKEEEASRQAALLKVLTDTLPVRMAYVDSDERYRYVNDTYLRWYNLKADQVLGRQVREVVGGVIYAIIAPHIKEVLAGNPVSFEGTYDYVVAGRRHILASYSPQIDDLGRVNGFFVLLQDMTEHRQAEGTSAWLAAIVESSHDAIISRSFDGTVRSWNRGAELMFGYNSDEVLGKKIDFLFPAEFQDGFDDLDLLCRGAGVGHCEPRCLIKDGRFITVMLTQSPILGQNGKPVAVSVIMSDINARKEVERQVIELNKDLEKKVAERTSSLQHHMAQLRKLALDLTQTEQRERQRLAMVLHNDLQQLLVAAGLRLERLANTEANAGRHQAIQQVETLLSQAVAATRSLATDLRPPVLNSGNLVKSLHWLADWIWKKFDLSLKFSVSEGLNTDAIPDEDIVFLFDTARELCFNIVKHAHVKEARMILQRDEQNHLCLTISDDGVGMDLQQQELPVTADGGLGLGTIKNRLSLIGGEVHIKTAVGKGFCVVIILPYQLKADSRPQGAVQSKTGSPEAGRQVVAQSPVERKIRVMLVDDHAVVRDGLKMILLDETDIDVIGEAGDGEKALRMAQKLLPDVIIMDVNMPKMNGLEATKLIKQDLPEICVIALSINDDQGTTNAMLDAGACAYLNKNGPAEDVCEMIRACVSGRFGLPDKAAGAEEQEGGA